MKNRIFFDAQTAGVIGEDAVIQHLNKVAGWLCSPPVVDGRVILGARIIPRAALEVVAGMPLAHRRRVKIAGCTMPAVELSSSSAVIAALEVCDVRAMRRESMARKPWTRSSVRRACWELRDVRVPTRTYFAKGTVSVPTPAGAVAVLGGTEAERVTFLDRLGRPIAAYCAVSDGPRTWAVADEVGVLFPLWEAFYPLGQSAVSIIFGVHG